MKLSDLRKGDRILVPCPSCHYKKSLVFVSVSQYERAKSQMCNTCRAENQNHENICRNLDTTRNHRTNGIPQGCVDRAE